MSIKQHKRSVFTYSQPAKLKDPSSHGIFYSIMSFFRSSDPRTPMTNCIPRLKNLITQHYRGLFGVLVPICALTWQGEKGAHHITVQCMWMWMFWFFLLQPVSIPVTGFIPIFLLPMAGVLSTTRTCQCYMNENIALFILSNMLVLLLNNSGADRRIALWLICSGDNCQFSGKRLVFKCGTAAFFLSMFSNRLLVTSTITQYITEAMTDLQTLTDVNRATEDDYIEICYIINNAIQTSSAIGSIAIMHSAYATLCFRAMFCESAPKGKEYPDIFNYLDYSAYAFPVASLMFITNYYYHTILLDKCVGKPMSANSMKELRYALMMKKNALPLRVSFHEKLTVFYTILSLVVFFSRWSIFLDMGWAEFSREETSPQIPGVKDATVAAIFTIALHILPKGYGWLKYFTAEKKSELPQLKPESAILWWRFVDKNLNYGYIFLIGSGVALQVAIKETGLDKQIVAHFGKVFTDHKFGTSLFLVCLVTVFLSNVMSGVAACVVFLPLISSLATEVPSGTVMFRSIADWPSKMYLGALGVGVGSSLGFIFPYLYTPAYYCRHVGKVPVKRMAKYSLGSAMICFIILWLSLIYYAPGIWDPDGKGVIPVAAPGAKSSAAGSNSTFNSNSGNDGDGDGDGGYENDVSGVTTTSSTTTATIGATKSRTTSTTTTKLRTQTKTTSRRRRWSRTTRSPDYNEDKWWTATRISRTHRTLD